MLKIGLCKLVFSLLNDMINIDIKIDQSIITSFLPGLLSLIDLRKKFEIFAKYSKRL